MSTKQLFESPAEEQACRRLALRGGIVLLLAFFCPILGVRTTGFSEILEIPIPSLRLCVLAPVVLGGLSILIALTLKRLARGVAILALVGFVFVMVAGALSSLTTAYQNIALEAGQPPSKMGGISLSSTTLLLPSIALLWTSFRAVRFRPDVSWTRYSAVAAGTVLLTLMIVPFEGETSLISLIFNSTLWRVSWGIPLAIGALLLMSLLGVALLFPQMDAESFAHWGCLLLMILTVVLIASLFFIACPFQWIQIATFSFKTLGSLGGIGSIFAAGILELALCTMPERNATPEAFQNATRATANSISADRR